MNTFAKIMIASLSMVGLATAQPKAPDSKPAPGGGVEVKGGVGVKIGGDKTAGDKAAPMPPKAQPPQQLLDGGKAMQGTWRCTGDGMAPNGQMIKMTAIQKARFDLDKWWIVESFDATFRGGKFKFIAYTTFDAGSNKWRRVMFDNEGGQMVGTSDGMKENKMVWNMDAMGPRGTSQFRDYVDMTNLRAGAKMWGEMSMDKGKTWTKVYEMTCKK